MAPNIVADTDIAAPTPRRARAALNNTSSSSPSPSSSPMNTTTVAATTPTEQTSGLDNGTSIGVVSTDNALPSTTPTVQNTTDVVEDDDVDDDALADDDDDDADVDADAALDDDDEDDVPPPPSPTNLPILQPTNDYGRLRLASYSGVSVLELPSNGINVMRRVADDYINVTQILRVAGLPKPQRTRILERDVTKGIHEKVQGGYAGFQGTWVPPESARVIAYQHGVGSSMEDIFTYINDGTNPAPQKTASKRPYAKRDTAKKRALALAAAMAANGTTPDPGFFADMNDQGDTSSYYTDEQDSITRPASRASSSAGSARGRAAAAASAAATGSRTGGRGGRRVSKRYDSVTPGNSSPLVDGQDESPIREKRRRVGSANFQLQGGVTPMTSAANSRSGSPLQAPSPMMLARSGSNGSRPCDNCGMAGQWRRGTSGKFNVCANCGHETEYTNTVVEHPVTQSPYIGTSNLDYDAIDYVNQPDFFKKRIMRTWSGQYEGSYGPGDMTSSPRSDYAVVPGSQAYGRRKGPQPSSLFNDIGQASTGSVDPYSGGPYGTGYPMVTEPANNATNQQQLDEFKDEFERGQSNFTASESGSNAGNSNTPPGFAMVDGQLIPVVSPKKRRGRPPKTPKAKAARAAAEAAEAAAAAAIAAQRKSQSLNNVSPSGSPNRLGGSSGQGNMNTMSYNSPGVSPQRLPFGGQGTGSQPPPPLSALRFTEDDDYYPPMSPTAFGTPSQREVAVASKRLRALLMLEETLNDEYGAILSSGEYEANNENTPMNGQVDPHDQYYRMQMHRDNVLAEYHRKKACLRRSRYYQEQLLLSYKYNSTEDENAEGGENDYDAGKTGTRRRAIMTIDMTKEDEAKILVAFVESVKKHQEQKEYDIRSLKQYAELVR